MPRSRPASSPVSYHKQTNQYYVTRCGRRIYLGSDREQALKRYHEIGLGIRATTPDVSPQATLTLKELANRFIAAQRANWRNPETTLKCYMGWLGRLLSDHPQLRVAEFTVERFAGWKLSLKERGYSAESINHYLCAVRAMFRFADDVGLIERSPRLSRVRNESKGPAAQKSLYTPAELQKLTDGADRQLKAMIMLALNCGFGPKDIHDLTWDHIEGERVPLSRGSSTAGLLLNDFATATGSLLHGGWSLPVRRQAELKRPPI